MKSENKMQSVGPPLSNSQIESLETEIGFSLPDDYRLFLLKHNGGTPSRALFSVGEGKAKQEFWVDDFFVISDKLAEPDSTASTQTLAYWNALYGNIMPSEAMMIGCACRDSILILYLSGSHRGQIHLVDWDLVQATSQSPTVADIRNALKFVSASFSSFFDGLYEDSV